MVGVTGQCLFWLWRSKWTRTGEFGNLVGERTITYSPQRSWFGEEGWRFHWCADP